MVHKPTYLFSTALVLFLMGSVQQVVAQNLNLFPSAWVNFNESGYAEALRVPESISRTEESGIQRADDKNLRRVAIMEETVSISFMVPVLFVARISEIIFYLAWPLLIMTIISMIARLPADYIYGGGIRYP